MKKSLLIVSIFVISSFMIFSLAQAASGAGRKAFGGKIENEEALEITTLEEGGYTCAVPGDTFDIIPVGKSSSGPYLATIPAKGGGTAAPGRWVLGLYSLTPTTITCTKPCPPPPGNTCVETVKLFPITIFGVSLK